ncbi:hypothetical protein TNIN_246251 [Trichonephila inaurata madagascariensis]|uniref:Uncharacterized protein n=1 Tax=Trichonephila inaurata madagascariensis TaxID=2747483 RepID=A0A8X6YRD7_9ARAC|nr:hypothetical protein TNIN_246251 [Trichonephila inaurata madagascariensis]
MVRRSLAFSPPQFSHPFSFPSQISANSRRRLSSYLGAPRHNRKPRLSPFHVSTVVALEPRRWCTVPEFLSHYPGKDKFLRSGFAHLKATPWSASFLAFSAMSKLQNSFCITHYPHCIRAWTGLLAAALLSLDSSPQISLTENTLLVTGAPYSSQCHYITESISSWCCLKPRPIENDCAHLWPPCSLDIPLVGKM